MLVALMLPSLARAHDAESSAFRYPTILPDETWSLGESAAKRLHESFIALAAFGAGSGLCLFR
jgi:hypothetical protein